ncbi:vitamin B12 dependent-methionine synthase activation domain-containing protein [Bacteroides sp.]
MSEYRISYPSLHISSDDFSGIFSSAVEAEMLCDELGSVIKAGETLIEPWGMVVVFDTVEVGIGNIRIGDTDFECGKKISGLLKGSEKIAVFVCTVGPGVTFAYKNFTAEGDPLKAYLVDMLGSIAVEKAMDRIQQQIAGELSEIGLKMTNRFSPGYCNWLVKEQRKLFSLLPPSPCGIQLSESALMIPSKSISGIWGIGSSVRYVEHNCSLCGMKSCLYREKLHNKNK